MRSQIYSIKDIVAMATERQNKKFDFNIAVSGARGNGKSTFLLKLFLRFSCFRPKTHIVYKRKEVMRLLEENKYICIMDDEAIRTGYKRNFFEADQKILIQMMNMYRDNFNVYGMAIPNFYSLDKGVRELIKIHIQIIERGLGVIHIAQSSLYSDDAWDVNYNKKVEERWAERKKKNPNFKIPYHKLTTFFGYIKFSDVTKKQRELYEQIKQGKRKEMYEEEMRGDEDKEKKMYEQLLRRLREGKLNEEMFNEFCYLSNLKYQTVRARLNKMLIERGIDERVKDFLEKGRNLLHSSHQVSNYSNNVRIPVI